MTINVDISCARAVNERLPAVINQVTNTKNTLAGLRSSIDSRILDRGNLRVRLRNAQQNIESMENDLQFFHRTIAQNLNLYEENENRLLNKVQNMPVKPGK